MSAWLSFRRQALCFALLALGAFALSQQSVVLFVLVEVIGAASWFVARASRAPINSEIRETPLRLATTSVVGLIIVAGVWVYAKDDSTLLPPAIGFAVCLLLLFRLFVRRTLSGERQLLMLSSVVLIVAVLEANDLLVAAFVFVATMLGVSCVIQYRLAAVAFASRTNGAVGRGWFGGGLSPVGATPSADLKRTIRVALGLIFAITLTLFVLFPRNPNPTGGLFALRSSHSTEFPDHISLMSPQRLEPSQREMLSVQWLGPDGDPLAAPGVLRLRGVILELYDAATSTWTTRAALRQRFVISESDDFQTLATRPVDERFNTFTQRVLIRGLRSDVILSAWAPVTIRGDTAQVYTIDPRTLSLRTMDIDSAGPIVGYDLRVQPFASDSVLAALYRGEPRIPPHPTFPVESIRVEASRMLAASGHADLTSAPEGAGDDPAARWARNLRIARAFESELTSDRFRYTLDLRDFVRRGERDPIDLFLTEYRFGHCEYFASALCALCQSVGVDARIVTGFLARDYQSAAARYIVRESDAHAWVEIRTGRFQWTAVDATPADDSAQSSSDEESWTSILRVLYDPFERVWQSQVAQFDARAQNALMQRSSERVGATMREGWAALEQIAMRTGESARIGLAGYIWLGSVLVTVVFSVAAALMARRTRLRARRALGVTRRDRAAIREAGFYVEALDVLVSHGIRRPSNVSPRAFAAFVRLTHHEAGEVFSQIVERFYAIRFGAQHPDAHTRADDCARVAQLRRALSKDRACARL